MDDDKILRLNIEKKDKQLPENEKLKSPGFFHTNPILGRMFAANFLFGPSNKLVANILPNIGLV